MNTETNIPAYQGRVLTELTLEELRDAEGVTINQILEHEDKKDAAKEDRDVTGLQGILRAIGNDRHLIDAIHAEIDIRLQAVYAY